MIPKAMEAFLQDRLPARTWKNRLQEDHGRAYMEFGPLDVDRLSRLGIEVDKLGPRLVVCMWDQESDLEIGGYLVVDNLAMGRPSMGGIRMLPDITPADIHNLARGMTLKNAAAGLPYGGGKSGIVAPKDSVGGSHTQVVEGFARLIQRYTDIYLPGPDVGTNDADMKTIAIINGLDNALSKPADMGGNRIDQLGAAASGVIIALETLLTEIPRLRTLPQCSQVRSPDPDQVTVLIQGFGAVGAHAARILIERIPASRVLGVSDQEGYLFNVHGLPVRELFSIWEDEGLVVQRYFTDRIQPEDDQMTKYSNCADDLLRESTFCLIPAAPIANYLDVEPSSDPCMTVDKMGQWDVIIEGANTYSPDPERKAARARMERIVYRERGVMIATDYLVNSGGVIYAAQEHLIKTPSDLRIPDELLGNRDEVEKWLIAHSEELSDLADRRKAAAERYCEDVIQRNMHEVIDLLVSDSDMLPCEAAERISIRRITASESHRTAADVMAPIPTVTIHANLREAAGQMIDSGSQLLAVVSEKSELVGVITEWDITQAVASGAAETESLEATMTKDVIIVRPDTSLLEVLRTLEHHEISAMPVVDESGVQGIVSSDLLATRSLLRLLQSQVDE